MTAQLRNALTAGEADTPPGVDLIAVRRRAGRIRRRRIGVAAGTAAALTVIAVAVPFALVRPDRAPVATPAVPVPACPVDPPDGSPNSGPGLDRALVPMTPVAAAICTYKAGLTGMSPLTATEAQAIVARLDAPPVSTEPLGSCGLALTPARPPFEMRVVGEGRIVTLRFGCQPGGRRTVDNGVIVKPADPAFVAHLTDRAVRESTCPGTPPRDADVRTQPVGPTLLPAATYRLVLCAYAEGKRLLRRYAPPDDTVALLAADARSAVAALNSAPLPRSYLACSLVGGSRQLVIIAIAPDKVQRAVATLDCGTIQVGSRTVQDRNLVRDLYGLATEEP